MYFYVLSLYRISRPKLTQTRQHTSRWTAAGRGWPEPWGWATRRPYTGDLRRWTSAGSVWWPSPWRSGMDCVLCVCVCVERYRLYCMCVVESMENAHKYSCASIFLDLMKITFSRIHRFVDNDTFNTICY